MLTAWQAAALPQRRAALFALQSEVPPTTATTTTEVLPRREAAQRFHRHPSFVDRLVRTGLLSPVKLKGRKRSCGFRVSDIEALLAGGEQ